MIRKILYTILIAVFVFVSADSHAGKYKSSSSKSSFSNRSSSSSSFSSKPRTEPTKWSSSSSRSTSSSSSAAMQQKYQQDRARVAYQQRQQQQADAARQRALAESQRLKSQQQYANRTEAPKDTYRSAAGSSNGSTYRPTTATSNSSNYRPSSSNGSTHTTIVRERDSFDVGDALVGAAVMSMLTNNSSASTTTTTTVPATTLTAEQRARDNNFMPPPAPQTVSVKDVSALPTLKVCTGPQNQHYYAYGSKLASIATKYNVEVVPTAGSIENIANLGSKCDIAIMQRDAIAIQPPNGQRVSSPYADVGMMMCTEQSGIIKLNQIKSTTKIAVPSPLSGSYITFNNLMKDKKHVPVPSTNLTEQLVKLRTNQVDCAFTVGTPTSDVFGVVKNANLTAIDLSVSDFSNTTDVTGSPVYFNHELDTTAKFPLHGYRTLFGYKISKRDATTIAVPNDVVISNKLSENNHMIVPEVLADIDSLSR